MKGLMVLLVLGLASSDKLDRTYLPPPGAKSSGGNLGAVDAPLELPKESPSTTIRPRPKYPVRPEDTELTVGISRGQPSPTGAFQGFTSTTQPSKYITSTTPTPTPASEGFGTTASPTGPTEFPSGRPGQNLRPVYGPTGQIIGVTSTPASVEVCEDGDTRCQQGKQVSPIYGQTGQINSQQVTPTQGILQGLEPVYGPNGEIINVTRAPGPIEICKEGDVRCQKQTLANVPVYSPSGQIVGYQPSDTSGSTSGINQGLRPVYGANGEIIGLSPTQGTVESVYGPNGQIIRYQPNVTLTSESTGLRPVYGQNGEIIGVTPAPVTVKQSQINVPVYGSGGQIVGYEPSVTPKSETVQGLRPVYGQNGEIIGVQPTPGTVQEQEYQKNPIYSTDGKINAVPKTETVQSLHPVYGLTVTAAPGMVKICKEDDEQCLKQAQSNVPIYDPSGKIVGYQPNVTPTPGTKQSFHSVYGQNGEIIGVTPTPGTVEVCQEGDVNCQKRAQQNVPVYGSSGQIVGYQPSATLTPGSVKGPITQGKQIVPVYGPNGKVVGYQTSFTPTPAPLPNVQPVYSTSGQSIGQRPSLTSILGMVQVCKEGEVQCLKQAQQNVPIYGPNEQIIGYKPIVTPSPATAQGLQPVFDSRGETVDTIPSVIPAPGFTQSPSTQKQKIVPVYGTNGQIIGYKPNMVSTIGTVQSQQPVYGSSGQFVNQQPTSETLQACREGDVQCAEQNQQNVPVYDSSGQYIGYQPKITPSPVTPEGLSSVYGQTGEIIGVAPTPGIVELCKEGDMSCQKGVQKIVPIYGPNGRIVGYQPSVIPKTGILQGPAIQREPNISIYGPNGQIVGYQPSVTSTPATNKGLQPVYGTSGQIIGQQPIRLELGQNGQIVGQELMSTPGTTPTLQPTYGPSIQFSGQRPTQVSPTTGKPITGGTKNIYRPASTVRPSVTTPNYFPISSVSTTPTPFQIYGTTPAGVVITPAGSNTERPLAESDRKAVTINYDITLTPEGYSYNFDTSNGIHVDETGVVKDGNKAAGTYSYIGDDGKEYQVTYTADENGFQPTGDHLPTPHPIPAEIKRVIEQAVKDKQSGISDDGSYDEAKYGHERYDRPNRPQSGDQQLPAAVGHTPTKTSHGEKGYYYTRPKSKFPPRLPERGQTKQPQGKYEEKSTTPDASISDDEYVPGSSNKYKPKQESGITTYRPTGSTTPGQVDVYGRLIPSRLAQGVGSTSYRPSLGSQGQVDKYGRPTSTQPGQDSVQTVEPGQEDKYGKPIITRPGQGYSSTTNRPVGTIEPLQVDKYGRPIFSQPEEETFGTAKPGRVDQYGRPISSTPKQGISTSTYRPTIRNQLIQVDKFGRPIDSQPEKQTSGISKPEKLDIYGRPVPSQPGEQYSTTTYRPVGTTKPLQEDKFRNPSVSQPGKQIFQYAQPGQVDGYGTPILSTSRPGEIYVDKYGRPIYSRPGEQTPETAEPSQVDKFRRPISLRPGEGIGSTTYKPVVTTELSQVDELGKPIYSQSSEEPSETGVPSQVDEYGRPLFSRPRQSDVDKYGRPIYSQIGKEPSRSTIPGPVDRYGTPILTRPGERTGSTTYRPIATTEPSQKEKIGRPIYSQPGEEPSRNFEPGKVDEYGTPVSSRPGQENVDINGNPIYSQPEKELFEAAKPGQVDKYGKQIPSRPRQEYSPTTSRPTESTGSALLDAFGRPIISSQHSKNPESGQLDKYGRPFPSRPGQVPSSTTYRPVGTVQSEPIDEYGRPISYASGKQPGSTSYTQVDAYGRPVSSGPGQGTSGTTFRPISSTQAPDYSPGLDVSEDLGQKPEEFGPNDKQGPAYLSPYEEKPGQFIGEDFRGPKQPPRFDPKTGYHY